MPLARYFVYVGGVLLVLLFIADFSLPKSPLSETTLPHFPRIVIASEQRWPERVVFDTSVQMNIPAPLATSGAEIPAPPLAADVSVKARQALAQIQSSSPNKLRTSDRKTREPRLHRQSVAKRSIAPVVRVARQPQYGWFGYSIW
jgi:hypothetical protein